jgi:diacylglycerol kinase family enzyme
VPESLSPKTDAARRIAVIVNGNAKSVTEEVLSTLDEILEAGDLFVSRSVEEGREIAKTVVDRGYGTVLTGGGDGTFTSVVSTVVPLARKRGQKPPRFGLLRLGTGNSLAWVVGASNAKGRGLAADIQRLRGDAGARPMRLVEVEGTLAPFCGFGTDANVLADFHAVRDAFRKLPLPIHWTGGLVSYAIAATTRTIPAYLVKPIPHVRVINLGADAQKVGESGRAIGRPVGKGELIYEGKARMVSVGTIPYYGFGFRVFPYADEHADRMQLRITTIGSIEFVANFSKIWRGDYVNPTTLFDWWVDRVRIEIEPATPFQIGGDAMGSRTEVEVALSAEPIELVDFYAPPRG